MGSGVVPTVGEVYAQRYRILRRLGEGGMGTVFEALDTTLDRRIALKVVSPALADRDAYRERFAREAALLARVRSRHIVHIHEYGQEGDTVYLTTELFPDGDLRNRLAMRGALPRREALSVAAQLCEALGDAHDVGVVHRDVKPANVLLWERAGTLLAYLCDFGIAVDGSGDGTGGLTRTGGVVGSPAYMAPERHLGADADERGDVYSLGCVLWAALTGSAPYAGTDFQIITSHVQSPVPALGTGTELDDRIDALLARALDKEPEQRFPSVHAMGAELAGILADLDTGRLSAPAVADAPAPAPETGGATRMVAARERSGERPGEAPESGTVIREATPVPPVRAEAPAAEEAPVSATPSGRSRRGLLALALVLLLVLVGGVATAMVVGGDDEPTTSADPTPTTATSGSEPPSLADPEVRAAPAYRSVRFTVTAEDDAELEVDTGQGWRALQPGVLTVPTQRGGEQACVQVRAAGSAGEGVRRCGRSTPPTVSLVREALPCSRTIEGTTYPCTYYSVRVEGLAPGTSPRAEVLPVGAQPWCQDPSIGAQFCRRVEVGPDGRGGIDRYFAILTDSGSARLRVDGVTTAPVRLFCGEPCA